MPTLKWILNPQALNFEIILSYGSTLYLKGHFEQKKKKKRKENRAGKYVKGVGKVKT